VIDWGDAVNLLNPFNGIESKFTGIIPKDIPAAVPRRVPAVNDAG